MNDPNETALIATACKGDLDAFNCLVLAYQDAVYYQAYRMLGEPEAAEDAAQDAFISAFRHLSSYRRGSFKAWLLRIVTNICYDELRRRKRRPTTPLEPVDEEDDEIETPSWIADPGESPEDACVCSELAQAIQHGLGELPEAYRAALILVDIQGLDYAQASQAIGKPLGTLKSRLARGRKRLRDCLQEDIRIFKLQHL